MKILLISLYYFPDKTGIAVTSTEVAEWFAKSGDEVTVITGPPFYPEWKIDEKYKNIKKEIINDVTILRTKIYIPKKVNSITRMLHEISFLFKVFIKLFFVKKPDIIILVTPPLTVGLVAILFKKIWHRKLLLNVKDLVPDAAIELKMLSNKCLIKILYILEKFIYEKSDKIASIGNGMLNRIEKKGIDKKKLVYLPDTADPQLINAEVKPKDRNLFLTSNKIKDEFIVLHSGNMGVKQGLDVIVKSAKILKNYPIAFFIVGDGAVKSNIINLAKSYKLNNVKFLSLQPRDFLADMYHAADICLLTQKSNIVDIVVPSKLISMMAAGSCVVASVNSNSEGAKIILESDGGSVVEPENPEALAKEILFYYNNPNNIIKKKRNAKKYISEKYNREKVMLNYRKVLKKMLSE